MSDMNKLTDGQCRAIVKEVFKKFPDVLPAPEHIGLDFALIRAGAEAVEPTNVQIPTDTMEQEFQAYYRRGFEAGVEYANMWRRAAERLTPSENQMTIKELIERLEYALFQQQNLTSAQRWWGELKSRIIDPSPRPWTGERDGWKLSNPPDPQPDNNKDVERMHLLEKKN